MCKKEDYTELGDDQIEQYRQEARARWGEDCLKMSENRVIRMGKEGFAKVLAEGTSIFETIARYIPKGSDSDEVQEQIIQWRKWLDNFSTYSEEAILELGRAYSQDSRFAKVFSDINMDLPKFLTKAIEYYCTNKM